jgi:hypothetical protein
MKVAIMQPYFLPYIGYFQLINAVDIFVIYDNIQYSKKGWINRNRILVNGKAEYLSLPLKKDSDYLQIKDRYLADSWYNERSKMLNKVQEAYRKAPFFEPTFTVLQQILSCESINLFEFLFYSIHCINNYLAINTHLVISSTLPIDHSLRSQYKVMALCKELGATKYINPIGGKALYDANEFSDNKIELAFLKSKDIVYQQEKEHFIPDLTILDVMMFNSPDTIREYLNQYTEE